MKEAKLHITGKTPPNFRGNRLRVWKMIREGMSVNALFAKCKRAGLNGPGNLQKIAGVYGCVKVVAE